MTPATEFVASKRALLDKLELFVPTDRYRLLRTVVGDSDADLPEAWLLEWLISPAFGLDGLPIDIADEPGGTDLLEIHLMRIIRGTGA